MRESSAVKITKHDGCDRDDIYEYELGWSKDPCVRWVSRLHTGRGIIERPIVVYKAYVAL